MKLMKKAKKSKFLKTYKNLIIVNNQLNNKKNIKH